MWKKKGGGERKLVRVRTEKGIRLGKGNRKIGQEVVILSCFIATCFYRYYVVLSIIIIMFCCYFFVSYQVIYLRFEDRDGVRVIGLSSVKRYCYCVFVIVRLWVFRLVIYNSERERDGLLVKEVRRMNEN